MAERLLAVLLDGSPVVGVCALLVLLALDVRAHVVIPILKAYGARQAAKFASPPMPRDRPSEHSGETLRGRLRADQKRRDEESDARQPAQQADRTRDGR